ncbi:hypothetical protein DACRYDRAFT_108874 [Dacryopinax primogenitus]|nr:uncharacterized protein DACRYDRAFT_108874 [Dacryopinax primogenitus]EJU00821.1 hypothetical protein DACRYDRAFT_108874 [Dacryopinax primogenitus]
MLSARLPDTTSLPLDGHQLVFQDILVQGDDGRTRPLFRTEFDSKRCVVKFSHTYGVEAHELLAKAGLAPALFHAKQVYHDSFWLIVMDHVDGKPFVEVPSEGKDSVLNDLSRAVQHLAASGLVHGDLRELNIMCVKEDKTWRARLVDFEWSGGAGKARYPVSLNDTGEIGWHSSVKRDGFLERAHDEHMLKRLMSGR